MKGDMVAIAGKNGIVSIPADELRIGDIVLIQTGDVVPADLTLLDAVDMEVDEFELTGEVMPARKRIDSETAVLVFQGSRVLRGHGRGVVAATGENTEYGRISKQALESRKRRKIHLLKKSYFGPLLLLACALLVRLNTGSDRRPTVYLLYGVLALLLLLLQNEELFKRFLMRRQQKKLSARNIYFTGEGGLDEIDRIDVFCFDKTGVLTSRDVKVKRVLLGGKDSSIHSARVRDLETWNLILTGCALCHDRTYYEAMAYANPLDRALMSYAEENGIRIEEILRSHQRIYQKPFNSEERYMASGFNDPRSGEMLFFAKGDPEVVLRMCSAYVTPFGELQPLDFPFLSSVRAEMNSISKDGSVVLALAYGRSLSMAPPSSYTCLCLFQLQNPLEPETKKVLHRLRREGIRNAILTGDRTETAMRVGVDTGISDDAKASLTGRDIEKMPLSEVARQCKYVSVFSRLMPSQKGVIIRLLQQKGHKIAMVGDGPNDVIALRAADVGISFVERSSPMARRAANILISDLGSILDLKEAARRARRQAEIIAVCITLIFLVILWYSSI